MADQEEGNFFQSIRLTIRKRQPKVVHNSMTADCLPLSPTVPKVFIYGLCKSFPRCFI
uniref:Uncharacterized protein n=1 Tax=Rhizophora mucronata TaxID=61149 RepID=A0A2P2QEU5_RHIMU